MFKQLCGLGIYTTETTAHVMDDFGNLVPLDVFALVATIINGYDE